MIEVHDVTKRYGRTLALDAVSLSVRGGEVFALLGPNGAGKTTLLDILCTIGQPTSGTARVGGRDVVRDALAARRHIGVVFQEPTLDDRLTVFENLSFHGRIFGVPRRKRLERIRELLGVVELEDWRDHLVSHLSSGMKRRLEIARALVHDASILFLDEPTVGLDAQSRERIWEYIARLREERDLTILVTTHYIAEVEDCDRVCVIDHGRILASGSPSELKSAHGQELLRVRIRDERVADEILAHYGDAFVATDGELIAVVNEDHFVERFLSKFGDRIRYLRVDTPSLESVFLSLTGRELRDKGADVRERTLAFGKRGGEHTR